MNLLSLMDVDLFTEMQEERMITVTKHPRLELEVLNYSPAAQYSRTWNDCTRNCRGLIINALTGEIVSRPFPKFFNLGELQDYEIPVESFDVLEKMDGSLGVMYPTPDGPAIATRGSFTSVQAVWATAWLRRYGDPAFFDPQKTYLFEILARWNRIVVNYDWEGLVLLAIIDTETGRDERLPECPRVLQAWATRTDSGEYMAPSREGVENVPSVQARESTSGVREKPGAASGVRSRVEGATREEGARVGTEARRVHPGTGSDSLSQAGEDVPGLRGELPVRGHGLRSRTGGEEVQRGSGEKREGVDGRTGEVRACLCGLSPDAHQATPFRIVRSYPDFMSLSSLLGAPQPDNFEGYVVRFYGGMRLKVKTDEYVRLHRIVTGVSNKTVWEHLSENRDLAGLLDNVPDEFFSWVQDTAKNLQVEFSALYGETLRTFGAAIGTADEHETRGTPAHRKAFAEALGGTSHKAAAFLHYDNRPVNDLIWKAIKPTFEKPFSKQGVDAE